MGRIDEVWLRDTIAGAIRSAIKDVAQGRHTLPSERSARSKRFVACLGKALHQAAQASYSPRRYPVRSHYLDKSGLGKASGPEFLWDIFVGRYNTGKLGAPKALLSGLWAVESELYRGIQRDFNKLIVADVEHRLLILSAGTRQVSRLKNQCRVAKVSSWIAEVDPLDRWSYKAGYVPHVNLQFVTPGR